MADAHPLQPYLDADPAVLDARWTDLQAWVQARFQREPTIEAILFLVGIQSQGRGFQPDLEKEAKEALVMEGTYCAFAALGIYETVGVEEDGSWIWERTLDPPPDLDVDAQEHLLKTAILHYFDDVLDDPPFDPFPIP